MRVWSIPDSLATSSAIGVACLWLSLWFWGRLGGAFSVFLELVSLCGLGWAWPLLLYGVYLVVLLVLSPSGLCRLSIFFFFTSSSLPFSLSMLSSVFFSISMCLFLTSLLTPFASLSMVSLRVVASSCSFCSTIL